MRPIVIISFIVLTTVLTPHLTQADPHRTATDPTAWWWYYGQTHSQINDVIESTGARLIDIEIQSTEPLRFAAAYVHNSGVYAETWWWYHDLTPADISDLVVRNEARLIDIERYLSDTGEVRYAIIMVDNNSADAKSWWWYFGVEPDFLSGVLDDNNARLVDLEAYADGGTKYAAIMIENTGDDASDWWWYFNVPASTIVNNIAAHGSRILEYQVRNPVAGTFDAILIPNDEADDINWWWYHGINETQVNAFVNQNGARISDLDTYKVGDTRLFSVVMVNNSNALTTKMGELLDYGADGSTGAYLKVVDGPVLASLQPNFVYEPASSIKVTHHLYSMREVMFGNASLSDEFWVAEGLDFSCPTGGPPINWQSLEETLQGMMQNSDNTDTEAIAQLFGTTNINNMSSILVGMNHTSINHPPGCPWSPLNEMTLFDSGLLYEGVATGLFLDPPHREDFYRLMQSETTTSPWWFTTDMEALVHDVAGDLGIPGAAADYWDNIRLAWKPGGDTLNLVDGIHVYRAVSGWVSLPYCGPDMNDREYVFGLFIHDGSNEVYCDARLGTAFELFRDEVTAGLQSCLSPVPDQPAVVAGRMLQPTYPNPFNPRTAIDFIAERTAPVTLAIYDISGRRVKVLLDQVMAEGPHRLFWNGTDQNGRAVSSGTYLLRLQTPDKNESQKIMLVR